MGHETHQQYPRLGQWSLDSRCFELGIPANEYFDGDPTLRAKAACKECTVRADCLEYALENMPHGFWAGTSQRERRRILTKRRARLRA